MPILRDLVFRNDVRRLGHLNSVERALLLGVTDRARRKFRRDGIVPAPVVELLKKWGLLDERAIAPGAGCRLETLLTKLRALSTPQGREASCWVADDSVNSELMVRPASLAVQRSRR